MAPKVLADAVHRAGMPESGLRSIRVGECAVYRHDEAAVVAKVGRSAQRFPAAEREVRVGAWLTSCGLPVERPLDIEQPDMACALPVTFWHVVDGQWTTPHRLAEILKDLHKLGPLEYLALPVLDPFARMRQRLAGLPSLETGVRDPAREPGG